MAAEKTPAIEVPPFLAVASVRPEYLEVCLEKCCTGASRVPSLEPGAITFLRRTSGGQGGRKYGVVGIWWYTGQAKPVRGGEYRWPRRWSYLVQFAPLVRALPDPFCEMFTETPEGITTRWVKASSKAPGLIFTALQGTIVRVRDSAVASGYIEALLKERREQLDIEAEYRGETVNVARLLAGFVDQLRCQAPLKTFKAAVRKSP